VHRHPRRTGLTRTGSRTLLLGAALASAPACELLKTDDTEIQPVRDAGVDASQRVDSGARDAGREPEDAARDVAAETGAPDARAHVADASEPPDVRDASADAARDVQPDVEPCFPEPEVCNDLDDDCDGEADQGLDCEPCAAACPIDDLRSDLRVCVAYRDIETACGGDYAEDQGVVHTAPPEVDVTCSSCTCSAALRPVQWDRADPDCSVGFQREAVDCVPPGCEADLCADMTFGHHADVNLHVGGGAPSGVCTVPDGHTFRLCCRAGLQRLTQCPSAVCLVPEGAVGPVVWGEGTRAAHVCERAALPEVTAFTDATPVGLTCAGCPCEATADVTFCDEATSQSCTATAAHPACSTDCLVRFHPATGDAVNTAVRLSLTLAGEGAVPEATGGGCDLVDPVTLCDGAGEL